MILFPYGTDAPLNYSPWGCLGLIVSLVTLQALFTAGVLDPEPWVLDWGEGLQPLQWISSIFVHAGWGHLISNLVFLAVFGRIVEGKIGCFPFLALFLAIGIGQAALEQLLFLFVEGGGSLGASGAIYGLLGVSMIWAPKNTIDFVWWLLRGGTFNLTVQSTAYLYFGIDLFRAGLFGTFGTVTAELLHLMGAAVGLAVGISLLKSGKVDCENWDWFSVRAGKHLQGAYGVSGHLSGASREAAHEEERALAQELLDEAIAEGKLREAAQIYQDTADATGGWTLSEEELEKLALGLFEQGALGAAQPFIEESRRRFPGESEPIELAWGVLHLHASQFSRAVEILESVQSDFLSPAQELKRQESIEKAKAEIAKGAIEFFD